MNHAMELLGAGSESKVDLRDAMQGFSGVEVTTQSWDGLLDFASSYSRMPKAYGSLSLAHLILCFL